MPRGRSPNREKAFELWKKSDGKRLLRDIAEELGVSEAMVRKWKIRMDGRVQRYQTNLKRYQIEW